MTTSKKGFWRALRSIGAATAVLTGFAALPAGCLNRPIEPVEPRTTSTIVERLTQSSVDKIDLLLMIDNSGSMADKQQILKVAVPDLVEQLLNPKCVDDAGKPSASQPMKPTDKCPVDGTKREFDAILNVHVGVITSSLGSHGADSCVGDKVPSENDHGRLIDRKSTSNADVVPTWNSKGFLAWDPKAGLTPPAPTHNPPGDTVEATFADKLGQIVAGAGEVGCGFENQLEAWYRFAVDPDPYNTVVVDNNNAVLKDTDQKLLQQRKDFLRPDSLFAIVMLTDENDCSVRDGSQYFFALQRYQPGTNKPYHLPKPRAGCASDPNGDCCRSCGQPAGAGCDASKDNCDANNDGKPDSLNPDDDQINLRCFDQRHRFGIDFLYPVQRYIDGLTRQVVQDRFGQMVNNPLFTDLNPTDDDSNIRDSTLVFVAGIVGVPWQDIARRDAGADGKPGTADDKPNLIAGLDSDGKPVGGFQSGTELSVNKTWDVILGDPNCDFTNPACRPKDPLMLETVDPRMGKNPITGDPIAPPQQADGPNPINGHEWKITSKADLQYACIFDLVDPTTGKAAPVDCSTQPPESNCDCKQMGNTDMKPLCNGANGMIQARAKAYPTRRELQVLKAVGDQGIVGSICPAQLVDSKKADFGYRPAVGAIIERLKKALGGQCLPRSLTPKQSGEVGCFILEARNVPDPASCAQACTAANDRRVLPSDDPAVKQAKNDKLYATAKWNCFCEINQALGDPGKDGRPMNLAACQDAAPNKEPVLNEKGQQVDGWCYIDATTVPPTGNADVVKNCPASEKRLIRFVGKGNGAPGATLFITCSGE